MRDTIAQSRRLQLAFKVIAIICGGVLLLASAYSGSGLVSLDALSKFIAGQLQDTTQARWLCGIIFLSAGIFFVPTSVRQQRVFSGAKELSNDSYVLYLVEKYQIEKNLVLEQIITQDKIFSNIDEALAFVHDIECPQEISIPLTNSATMHASRPSEEQEKPNPVDIAQSDLGSFTNPFGTSQNLSLSPDAQVWDEAKRIKVTVISGVLLFTIALGGLFYANSHSARYAPSVVAAVNPGLPLPLAVNSDQVVSGSLVSPDVSSAPESKDGSKPIASTPINERWLGTWISDAGSKQKLLVTTNLLKFNDEEFTWAGTRPKGIVQCCLAFYEGATTKGDLLARISGAQEPSVNLKPEVQKTLALANGLSEGNFKRIVFVDPYLKKYFFIYDQNYVYRISRDLGDKVDVVIEQFKKQE